MTRRLQAPQDNGAVLVEPPLSSVGDMLAANRRDLSEGPEILGRPWIDLRDQARRSAVAAAADYLRAAGEPAPFTDSSSLIVAGHQPELFHPGVWIKNFALNELAQAHAATPLNLVVDNDTVKATVLRLPAVDHEGARLAAIPFDQWTGEVPYEERPVRDEELFQSLPERALEFTRRWSFTPLLPRFWAEVRRQSERTPLLGERLVAARRNFERQWGFTNLELPVSRLCATEPFAWFAADLLANAPRFHAIYNGCVHDYRRRHGLKSRNHPVPDLAAVGDWLELPLWGWRIEKPQRGRLLARPGPDGIELRVGSEAWPTLPPAQEARRLVEAWRELEPRGFKIRSRALTTTLFARLFLGDLFIHGIGGGKYDETTDDIIRRFYGIPAPAFLVLSGTLRLPVTGFPADVDDGRRLAHELHDLRCNPQRHLSGVEILDTRAQELAAAKHEWIERTPADTRARRERFHVLKDLTRQLEPYIAYQEERTRAELGRAEREIEANAVLTRRDYAFCLYPEALLRRFLTSFQQMGSLQPSAHSS